MKPAPATGARPQPPEKDPPQSLSPESKRIRGSPFLSDCFGAPALPAQPLEPILFPKLRIYFADFPYLHCSID